MDIALTSRDPVELVRAAWDRWKDPIWLALTVVGILAIPWIVWSNQDLHTLIGFDAFATWDLNFKNLYGIQYMDLGAFRYSPAYAQAFFWAHLLPWELFAALFIGASFFILWRWAGRWTIALIALPPVALELYHGNIHLFMAAAMVVGFRYPSAWAFPLLAKVTPGIAVLWFAGARQWRNLAIALGTTAAIAAVSFVIAPQQWIEGRSNRALGRLDRPTLDRACGGHDRAADHLGPRPLDAGRNHPARPRGCADSPGSKPRPANRRAGRSGLMNDSARRGT